MIPEAKTQNLVPVAESEGREVLNDEQLAELLTSFGNHELKAIQISVMQPDHWYGAPGLQSEMQAATGENADIGSVSLRKLYAQTFETHGMIVRGKEGRFTKFALTDRGERVGKLFAGLVLGISEKYDKPLEHIFGVSKGREERRAPSTRLAVVRALLEHDTLTPTELEGLVGIHQDVIQLQAVSMAKDGVVQYDATDATKSPVYRLPDPEFMPAGSATTGREAVAYLREHGEASLKDIVDYCWERLPEEQKTQQTRRVYTRRMRNNLNSFVRNGKLEGVGKHTLNRFMSFSDEQREMWSDIVDQLDSFKQQDAAIIDKLNNDSADFMQDQTLVVNAAQRAVGASRMFAMRDRGDVARVIGPLIPKGQEITARELVGIVKEVDGRSLSVMGLRSAIERYRKEHPDSIQTVNRNGVLYYTRKQTETTT